MATPSPNLWTVLTESKRILNAHARHFLALSVLFLLPISFFSVVFPTLRNLLVAVDLPDNSQSIFRIYSHRDGPTTTRTLILLALASAVCVFVFSLLAVGSITYSVFHGFYGRPVKVMSAIQSVSFSFFPVFGTLLVSRIVFLLIVVAAGLVVFLIIGGMEVMGIEIEYSSPYFIGVYVVVLICLVLCLLYLHVNWTLAGVVSVVEPRWGIDSLTRSASLIEGMRGVALCLTVFFGGCTAAVGFLASSSELRIGGGGNAGWRDWKSVGFVAKTVVYTTAMMVLLLYHAAANTVLYMYCKALHGELAMEIAEEFVSEYVSLPFDDGKMPHVVSVVEHV